MRDVIIIDISESSLSWASITMVKVNLWEKVTTYSQLFINNTSNELLAAFKTILISFHSVSLAIKNVAKQNAW